MTSDLERQLRENPDDAATWLVYGDWLLDHGDPRGELVRRGRPLTTDERDRYRGVIPAAAIEGWRHGFPVALALPLDARTAHTLRTIFAAPEARFVTALRLLPSRGWSQDDYHVTPAVETAGDPLAAVLALDLSHLHAFGIPYAVRYGGNAEAMLRAILDAPSLWPLAELDLRYCDLRGDGAALLANSPQLATVRRLHLQNNHIGKPGARALAESPHLRALERIDLRYNPIGDAADAFGEKASAYIEDGILTSPISTARFSVKRFVDGKPLYIDPLEWSFRTYENVIPLDRELPVPELAVRARSALADDAFLCTLAGAETLRALDELPYFVPPLDPSARGGERFIFHSARLAEAIAGALRDDPLLAGFTHVNPVFRCNRFEPGDAPFHAHVDTPYFDAARHHVSRYTVLVYLTGGRGAPALQLGDVALDAIDPLTCVVFHQRYEHAGAPYLDGRKLFLRTEVIFEDPTAVHDDRIAEEFSKACYLTGESVRTPALARDAARAYDRVAAAHWQGWTAGADEPFVQKTFRGVTWLANGYDFWFPKAVPLVECATLLLLDYFNCTIYRTPFRALCGVEVLRDIDPEATIAKLATASAVNVLDKERLFPPPERALTCCDTHSRVAFHPTLADDVIELYEGAQRVARARIDPAPIFMLGEEVFLDPSRFVVESDRIHVLSRERLAPVNFAACWNSGARPPDFVAPDIYLGVVQPLVPPILWTATAAAHRLGFDFFRNSWAASQKQEIVPVPRIATTGDDLFGGPWLRAARELGLAPDGRKPDNAPWWANGEHAGLLREMFPKRS